MSKALRLAAAMDSVNTNNADSLLVQMAVKSAAAELRRLASVEQELEALKRAISEAEPVGWHTEDHLIDRSATTYSKDMKYRWECKGWPVTPLYTLKGIK